MLPEPCPYRDTSMESSLSLAKVGGERRCLGKINFLLFSEKETRKFYGVWEKSHVKTCDPFFFFFNDRCPVSCFPFPQMNYFPFNHWRCFVSVFVLLWMILLLNLEKCLFQCILYRKVTVSLETVVPKGSLQDTTADIIEAGRLYIPPVYMYIFLMPSPLCMWLFKN